VAAQFVKKTKTTALATARFECEQVWRSGFALCFTLHCANTSQSHQWVCVLDRIAHFLSVFALRKHKIATFCTISFSRNQRRISIRFCADTTLFKYLDALLAQLSKHGIHVREHNAKYIMRRLGLIVTHMRWLHDIENSPKCKIGCVTVMCRKQTRGIAKYQ
jgi:hypothetical protein